MKKQHYIIILSFSLIVFFVFVGVSNISAQDVIGGQEDLTGWDYEESPVSVDLRGVITSPTGEAWSVGDNGTVIYNNGSNWTLQDTPSNADLYGIDQLENTSMVIGNDGVVLIKTENGTWQDVSLESSDNLKSISIVGTNNETTNNLIAYVVGENGNMWKTNNSGIEWHSIDLSTTVDLYSVDFMNETVGIVVGESATIIGTTDGGITWENRDVPDGIDGTFRAIRYYRESRVYIVGDNGIFLKSTSIDTLGWVWDRLETSTTEQLNSIYAYSSSKIFLAGQNGDVIITKNAGSTFIKEVLPSSLNSTEIFGISMINGTHGWIVGNAGNTFSTDRDGLLPDLGARVGDYSDFAVYWDYAEPHFIRGFAGMLEIYFFSMFLGFVLGVTFAVAKIVDKRILNIIANIYIDFIRNTPLIVQLFAIHFGLPNIGIFITIGNLPREFVSAVLGLGINSGAYQAEIIRAGIQSLPTGQMEAGRSVGLTYLQTMRHVILPQALRLAIPPLGNEMVNLSLNTSLVFAIGYFELARAGRLVIGKTFRIAQTWGLVLLFFFVFTYSITLALRYIENKSKIPGLGTN